MTTSQSNIATNQLIQQARRRYLAAHPLRTTDLPAFTATGSPAGSMTIPNIGDVQITGCKLGMEYLAICHDDEAVEEWIHTALAIAKDPEVTGVLLANVLRGMNVVIGSIIDNASLRVHMQQQAIEAWNRDFGPEDQS